MIIQTIAAIHIRPKHSRHTNIVLKLFNSAKNKLVFQAFKHQGIIIILVINCQLSSWNPHYGMSISHRVLLLLFKNVVLRAG